MRGEGKGREWKGKKYLGKINKIFSFFTRPLLGTSVSKERKERKKEKQERKKSKKERKKERKRVMLHVCKSSVNLIVLLDVEFLKPQHYQNPSTKKNNKIK